MTLAFDHVPVMLEEVIGLFHPMAGKKYIDATFGGGGYTRALLKQAPCFVWGIDRDPEAFFIGQELEKEYPQQFKMVQGAFADLTTFINEPVDGIVFDLGVSSYQLDCPERGFSFRHEGPLDMRMNPIGPTAAEVVNHCSQEDLADIIYYYGEERKARKIARALVKRRQEKFFSTTQELAAFLRTIVYKDKSGIDPATRTFQALRIFVNDEINQLKKGLQAAQHLLKIGGKLIVVAFHSLEDREVKIMFQQHKILVNRYGPPQDPIIANQSVFYCAKKAVIRPSASEVCRNPRARSARLRYGEKIASGEKP